MDEQRVCKECQRLLPLEKFVKVKRKRLAGIKIYYRNICMQCQNRRYANYRKERDKKIRLENPDFVKARSKKAYEKIKTTEKFQKRTKLHSISKRKEIQARGKNWYKNNKKRKYDKGQEWIKNNPEKYKAYCKKRNDRIRSTPIGNLGNRIRCCIRKSFNKLGAIKREKTFSMLGYSNIDLWNFLSKQLNLPCQVCNIKIITLDNSNIDHIIPMCVASSIDDVIKLNQLDNLRLICEECNLGKISQDLKTKEERNKRK
jgi:5-methylcytosine-specific restriction endonuclease McrA